jgi:hypothetical protein
MNDYFLTFISNIRDRRVEDIKKVTRIYNAQKDKQIIQWPKRKGTKSQTTIYKTLHTKQDRAKRTPLQTGDERRCSGKGR